MSEFPSSITSIHQPNQINMAIHFKPNSPDTNAGNKRWILHPAVNPWTPVRVGFTEVPGGGSITNTGVYSISGCQVHATCKIVAAGGATIAAIAGGNSAITGLPYTASDIGTGQWVNATTYATSGAVVVTATTPPVIYIATAWSAASGTWMISVKYRI